MHFAVVDFGGTPVADALLGAGKDVAAVVQARITVANIGLA